MSYASGVTLWEAFLPGLTVLFLAFALLPWLNRDKDWIRGIVIGLPVVPPRAVPIVSLRMIANSRASSSVTR